MKLSDVDNTINEGPIWDATKSAGRGLRTVIDYAVAAKDKLNGDKSSLGVNVANKQAIRNYTKIAKGMVKMWQRKYKDLKDSGQFESRTSYILSGIALYEAVNPAVTVVNLDPIILKYNKQNYILNDKGRWALEKQPNKTLPQSLEVFLNKQHDEAEDENNHTLAGAAENDATVQSNDTASLDAEESAELTTYKNVLGDWIGKVTGINDRSKINKVLKDLKTTDPNDNEQLVPAFVKALQLGASYSQELGTDGGAASGQVATLLKQISGITPTTKAADAVKKILTPKDGQSEAQTIALLKALVKQLTTQQSTQKQ